MIHAVWSCDVQAVTVSQGLLHTEVIVHTDNADKTHHWCCVQRCTEPALSLRETIKSREQGQYYWSAPPYLDIIFRSSQTSGTFCAFERCCVFSSSSQQHQLTRPSPHSFFEARPAPLQWRPCYFLSSTSKQRGKFWMSWNPSAFPLKTSWMIERNTTLIQAGQHEHSEYITNFYIFFCKKMNYKSTFDAFNEYDWAFSIINMQSCVLCSYFMAGMINLQ